MRGSESSSHADQPARAGRGWDVLDLQERERLRIAFDLHDGPAQSISAALLQARLLEGTQGDDLRAGLEELKALLDSALEDMYGIIEHLRSKALDNTGLVPKLQAYLEDFRARVPAELVFTADCDGIPLSDSMQIAVFRIVQEALSNIRRHAHATSIRIAVATDGEVLRCTISDDGDGFRTEDPPADGVRQRYGLTGMRERARLLDGACKVQSVPGRGTTVTLSIPLWRGA